MIKNNYFIKDFDFSNCILVRFENFNVEKSLYVPCYKIKFLNKGNIIKIKHEDEFKMKTGLRSLVG